MDRSTAAEETGEHPSAIAQLIAPLAGLAFFGIGLSVALPHPHNIESGSSDFPALAGFLRLCLFPLPFALAALAYQFVHWVFASPSDVERPRLRRLLFFAALAVTAGSDFLLLAIPRDRLETPSYRLDQILTFLGTYGAHFLAISTVLLFWCDKSLFRVGLAVTPLAYLILLFFWLR